MLIPPLALLFLVGGACFVPATGLALATGEALPLATLLAATASALFVTAVVWFREGRGIISGRSLLHAPLYVLWKIPVYLGFVGRRQKAWNRTKRSNET